MPAPSERDEQKIRFDEALAKIVHEHNLINHRMTWMMLSEAFLIAAYVNLRLQIGKPHNEVFLEEYSAFFFEIIFCGVFFCIVFTSSFLAAFFAIRKWRNMCDDQKKMEILTSATWVHFFGDLPPAVISWALLSLWFIIIYNDVNLWWRYMNIYSFLFSFLLVAIGILLWLFIVQKIFSPGKGQPEEVDN